ncbi:transposase for insertion sequence element IS1086 [Arthrobacter sp. Hiyo8]|nr:transposase for insertion sequence element IS1086 [Arthrobacter sp. Hiyo8]
MVKLFPPNARTEFVDLVCGGLSVIAASRRVGASHGTGTNWWAQCGQMTVNASNTGGLVDPAPSAEGPNERALSLAERGMIQMGRRSGMSYARIGEAIGRDKSVVWREVNRNTSADGVYYASVAHTKAHQARHRPKPLKLVENEALCRLIAVWMDDGWSPKLISSMLAFYFTDDQTMQVSHETIYQALYVQSRGILRADLAEKLSLKRKQRVPHAADRTKNSPYKEAFKISERPAEVQDRAVPGHWEGDLIIGSGGTAIGTLVERSTRFTILLHLPGDHSAETVAAAMIREMGSLPDHLRRSITWDRGTELADYARIQTALDATLYFCDPHSPWQRGTNENTNRLLRFWFEKGSDLSAHTPEDLRRVAAKLNRRPRPTLNLQTPANRLNQLLHAA